MQNCLYCLSIALKLIEGDVFYELSEVLEVELDGTGKFLSGKIHPLQLTGDGIPNPDPKRKVISLMQRLTSLDFPNTPLLITDDGSIVVKSGVPAQTTNP